MTRDSVIEILTAVGLNLVHNEPGDYDIGTNGYLIFERSDQTYFRVDFMDDSMTSGYYNDIQVVRPYEKTITVWE